MIGLSTRRMLERITHHQEEPVLGPESFGLAFKEIRSPHDVEARKWFRRTLIALCVVGFAVVFMPDALRMKLNDWAGTPTAATAAPAPRWHCYNDWHERCLVCVHHLATREMVTSTHC